MKKGVRIILIAAAACLLGLACLAINGVNGKRMRELTCAGVKVEFTDDFNFITAKDVEGYLNKDYGAYIGQRLDSVDLMKVEKILDSKGAVLKAEAYTTPDGYLNVRIRQRKPVIRFQKGNNGFYADAAGVIFPLQRNYTSMVPIIDGEIPLNVDRGYKGEPKTEAEKKWLSETLGLVNYMTGTVWAENISQITARDNGDLVLIPREGKERFIFGQPDDFEDKFDRIGLYYTTILPLKGNDYYSTVSIKNNGQIVCRK